MTIVLFIKILVTFLLYLGSAGLLFRGYFRDYRFATITLAILALVGTVFTARDAYITLHNNIGDTQSEAVNPTDPFDTETKKDSVTNKRDGVYVIYSKSPVNLTEPQRNMIELFLNDAGARIVKLPNRARYIVVPSIFHSGFSNAGNLLTTVLTLQIAVEDQSEGKTIFAKEVSVSGGGLNENDATIKLFQKAMRKFYSNNSGEIMGVFEQ